MNIEDMSFEELKFFYLNKCIELENLFSSDKFVWLENMKYIEDEYNTLLNKYKIYFYKKKAFILEVDMIKNSLYKIETVLLEKYNFSNEKRLTKKFDKESIL